MTKTLPGASTSSYEPRNMDAALPMVLAVMNGTESFLNHWHDSIEILMGLSGETLVGVRKDTRTLTPGKILIINSGESHSILLGSKKSERLAIIFSTSILCHDKLNTQELPGIFSQVERFSDQWSPVDEKTIRACVYDIWKEYADKQPGWREMCYSLLLDMALYACRSLPRSDGAANPEKGMLRECLAYLSQNYLADISLESCADALGYNRTYLSHQFKKKTGVSFHSYVVGLRLKQAEKLLQSTDLPIVMVSKEAGFQSAKSFYRIFKEHYGKSPEIFRKETRESKA